MRQSNNHIERRDICCFVAAIGISVALVISSVAILIGIEAVYRNAMRIFKLTLLNILCFSSLQSLKGGRANDGVWHVADAKHSTFARIATIGKVVHHHVDILVGVPKIRDVFARIVAHKLQRRYRICAIPFHVFHSRRIEFIALLVVSSCHKLHVHILAFTKQSARIYHVHIGEQLLKPCRRNILRSVVGILVDDMEYHGQLIFVTLVERSLCVVLVLVFHLLLSALAYAIVATTRRHHTACHQQPQRIYYCFYSFSHFTTTLLAATLHRFVSANLVKKKQTT